MVIRKNDVRTKGVRRVELAILDVSGGDLDENIASVELNRIKALQKHSTWLK
jgi:hypothetical protein